MTTLRKSEEKAGEARGGAGTAEFGGEWRGGQSSEVRLGGADEIFADSSRCTSERRRKPHRQDCLCHAGRGQWW